MNVSRRVFLERAAGMSAAGAGLAGLLDVARPRVASAVPPPGEISYAWFWGPDQTVPIGGWHDLAWPNPPVRDNDGYFDPANPTRINLVDGGLYNMIAEVSWPPNAAGIRGLRIMQGAFVIARAPSYKDWTRRTCPAGRSSINKSSSSRAGMPRAKSRCCRRVIQPWLPRQPPSPLRR